MKPKSVLLILAVALLAGGEITRAGQIEDISGYGVLPDVQKTDFQADRARMSEPTYKALPLSYWLHDVQLTSSSWPTPLTDEAKSAVAHIGTNAVPFLLKRLRGSDRAGLDDGIIEAFGVLGPAARSAVPELAWLATNQTKTVSRPSAGPDSIVMIGYIPLLALGRIGPDALPVLSTILTNAKQPGLRLGAIEAINSMGTNAVAAVPVLLEAVQDDFDPATGAAVKGLGLIGPRDSAALAALSKLSESPKRQLRTEALFALAHCSTQGAPALIRGLQDPQTCFIAFTSLVAASPQSLTNTDVLIIAAEGLRSPEPERRDWAAQVLRAAGQQAGGQSPDYAVPLGDMNVVFQAATNALLRLAPELVGSR